MKGMTLLERSIFLDEKCISASDVYWWLHKLYSHVNYKDLWVISVQAVIVRKKVLHIRILFPVSANSKMCVW